MRYGFPVLDLAGYHESQALRLQWQNGGEESRFALRSYQTEAVEAFEGVTGGGGQRIGRFPAGPGKTIIGIAALERQQCECLILTSNTTSVEQWIRRINRKDRR
ncbi:hypothetical protein VQ056_19415 [Paenibacillus sp. JTLBN-2024]